MDGSIFIHLVHFIGLSCHILWNIYHLFIIVLFFCYGFVNAKFCLLGTEVLEMAFECVYFLHQFYCLHSEVCKAPLAHL